jgi:hypothetical protein
MATTTEIAPDVLRHSSSFTDDCARALTEKAFKQVFGSQDSKSPAA